MSFEEFAKKFPWPSERPEVPEDLHGWGVYERQFRELLDKVNPYPRIVVELGCWLGQTTRWLAQNYPRTYILAVDHFLGSEDFRYSSETAPRLETCYKTFLRNLWDYRHQVIPMKRTTTDALLVLHENLIEPDLIYVDASHDFQSTYNDVMNSLELFPNAIVCGDDYNYYQGVREAVLMVCKQMNLTHNVSSLGPWPDQFYWFVKP